MSNYKLYWRNPKTRVMERIPGVHLMTWFGKPNKIYADWDGKAVIEPDGIQLKHQHGVPFQPGESP